MDAKFLDAPGRRTLSERKKHIALICIFLLFSLVQLFLLLKVSPIIVRGDGVGYYAYLRSLFFDRDIDFNNEFSYFESVLPGDSRPLTSDFLHGPRTATGYVYNHWPIGPALLWSPFFIVGHIVANVAETLGLSVAVDGYSLPYQLSVALGSAVYAFVGLALMYKLCNGLFDASTSLLSLLLMWFGTSLTAYMYFIPSMSHAVSFFCACLFIFIWYRTRNARSLVMWGVLGMLGGLMPLQRLQDGIFLLIIVVELCPLLIERIRKRKQRLNLAMSILIFGAVTMPHWGHPQ